MAQGPAGQGRLISEVDLTVSGLAVRCRSRHIAACPELLPCTLLQVWPGATGCVVTTSDVRLGVPPTQLIVTVSCCCWKIQLIPP
jgi:hypothetical protein